MRYQEMERRVADRRKQAKRVAKKIVLINIGMLILGAFFGYYVAMREVAGHYTTKEGIHVTSRTRNDSK